MKNHQKLKKEDDSRLHNGRYDKALKCFDMILASDLDGVGTLTVRGDALMTLEKNSEAIECFANHCLL